MSEYIVIYCNVRSPVGVGVTTPQTSSKAMLGVIITLSAHSTVQVFEPGARHTWMEMKGMYVANPVAMVLSSAFMLKHLMLHETGDKLIQAVSKLSCRILSDFKSMVPKLPHLF